MWTSSMACSKRDLNPFGFYRRGHVHSAVYSAKVSSMQDLKPRIGNGCGMIRKKHGIFQ